MRSVWLALALAACGDVNVVPDAAVPDAYQHDAPDDPMCVAGEMACNGLCANFMTSEQYCGNCMTSCAPNQGCIAGTCMPKYTDCERVFASDPMATSGFYVNPDNAQFFYCDMATKTHYSHLSLALWSATLPANYVMVRATDLTDAMGSKAFIALYNQQAGMPTINTFNVGNCCIKTAAGTFMQLDGGWMGTNPCQANMMGTFKFSENAAVAPTPLADGYFTANVPSEGANTSCSDNTNPMMIWQKRTF
jgi:hypothetical protein